MPLDEFTLVDQKAPDPVFTPNFRVTPAMRQKVENLAVWLAGGDRRKLPRATQAVMEMLCEAARTPPPLN
jgi:hypothetical protein